MERYLLFIIAILIGLLIYAVRFLIDFYRAKTLRQKIATIVSDSAWDRVADAQIKLGIPKEYSIIGETEWQFTRDIFAAYKKELQTAFLKDNLTVSKDICYMPSHVYLFFTLCSYLKKHQCDFTVAGYAMRGKRLAYKEYGRWGGTLFDATYEITDFSVVYHKLYYISYLYCKENKQINPRGEFYQNESFLQEILDSHQIGFSRL